MNADELPSPKVAWTVIFLVCAALFGLGDIAIQDALQEGGLSPEAAGWMLGIAIFTIPAFVASVLVAGILRSNTTAMPKLIGTAATIYFLGLVAAFFVGSVESLEAVTMDSYLSCGGHPSQMALCYLARGLGLFLASYAWQFLVAGALIYSGAAYHIYYGAINVTEILE